MYILTTTQRDVVLSLMSVAWLSKWYIATCLMSLKQSTPSAANKSMETISWWLGTQPHHFETCIHSLSSRAFSTRTHTNTHFQPCTDSRFFHCTLCYSKPLLSAIDSGWSLYSLNSFYLCPPYKPRYSHSGAGESQIWEIFIHLVCYLLLLSRWKFECKSNEKCWINKSLLSCFIHSLLLNSICPPP